MGEFVERGDVLAASSCSNSLSCCLLSFAHLANSSWLLVALSSPLTRRYSACSVLCLAACWDVEIGRKLMAVQSYTTGRTQSVSKSAHAQEGGEKTGKKRMEEPVKGRGEKKEL